MILNAAKKIKILLVDDEDLIRWSLGRSLETAGYYVDMVINGKEALQKLDEHKYDIVVTDLNMPDLNGIEMLAIMKERGIYTQVIVISAYLTDNLLNETICKNVFRCIHKPFLMEEVLHVIKEAESNNS